jgi:hypothetical protein
MFVRKFKMLGWLFLLGAVVIGAFKSDWVKDMIGKTGIKI